MRVEQFVGNVKSSQTTMDKACFDRLAREYNNLENGWLDCAYAAEKLGDHHRPLIDAFENGWSYDQHRSRLAKSRLPISHIGPARTA